MYRIRWSALRALPAERRREIVSEAQRLYQEAESAGQSAVFSMFARPT